MKVKILVSMAGKDFVYQAGAVLDLPPGEADEYIRLGRAEEIKEEVKPKQKPVKIGEVKAETRPIRKRAV